MIEEGEAPATSPQVERNLWRERAAWVLACVLLSGLAFFAAVRDHASSASEPERFSAYPPEKSVFSRTSEHNGRCASVRSVAGWTRHGVCPNSSGADPVIWMRNINQVTARPLPGTEHAQLPFWSPDSRWLGFFAEGKLKKIPSLADRASARRCCGRIWRFVGGGRQHQFL